MVEYQLRKHLIDVETYFDILQVLWAKALYNECITSALILKWHWNNIENYVSVGDDNEGSLLLLVIITQLWRSNRKFHSFKISFKVNILFSVGTC